MNEKPVNPGFPCKVIVFNIKNVLYGLKDYDKRPPYEATRKYWNIAGVYRDTNVYPFAVGLVEGVAETAYKISRWYPTQEPRFKGKRYEFDGVETKESRELKGRDWLKQRDACLGFFQHGGFLAVEFDGKGKFIIRRGQKDSQWQDC